ncbi:MAG: right-handed parallel beta-helix repeat-containing protein [Spirochaetales bacterium]|nr:right-handed parallel beta-helix repeat-containing protein [Spirochaetales bacterium]
MNKKFFATIFILSSFLLSAETVIKINQGEENLVIEKLNSLEKAPTNQTIIFQFMAGNFFFPEGIIITDKMMTGNGSIQFQGNGDANLFAGKEITGFSSVDGEKYIVAEVESGVKIFNFFSSKKNNSTDSTRIARQPDTGYFGVEKKASDNQNSFHVSPEVFALLEMNSSFTIWPGQEHWNWMTLNSKVTTLDPATLKVTGNIAARYFYDHGARFYITGSKNYITQPGEFFHDWENGKFYYYPENGEVPQLAVVATSDYLFYIKGRLEQPVSNIKISGLNLLLSNYTDSLQMADYDTTAEKSAMVWLESVANSEISGCKLLNAGFSAISITEASQNIRITDNEIAYAGYNGIFILGAAVDDPRFSSPEESYINKGHLIQDNLIYSCGKNVGHASGVQLYQSGDNLIDHNTIYDMPRYAVSYKGTSHWGKTGPLRDGVEIYGIKMNESQRYRFLHTRNNILSNNDMSQCMTDSQDGGIFEAWGSGRDNIIENNYFHSTKIGIDGGLLLGIYLDDGCDYYTLRNNVIEGLKGSQTYPIYAKGQGHTIENNFILNCEAVSTIAMWAMMGVKNEKITMSHNIFHQDKSSGIYSFFDWTRDKITYCDYNLYWNGRTSKSSYRVKGIPGAQKLWWWQSLYSRKFDQNSQTADPRFDLSVPRYFNFMENSPALKLGIKPIDLRNAGKR